MYVKCWSVLNAITRIAFFIADALLPFFILFMQVTPTVTSMSSSHYAHVRGDCFQLLTPQIMSSDNREQGFSITFR